MAAPEFQHTVVDPSTTHLGVVMETSSSVHTIFVTGTTWTVGCKPMVLKILECDANPAELRWSGSRIPIVDVFMLVRLFMSFDAIKVSGALGERGGLQGKCQLAVPTS